MSNSEYFFSTESLYLGNDANDTRYAHIVTIEHYENSYMICRIVWLQMTFGDLRGLFQVSKTFSNSTF